MTQSRETRDQLWRSLLLRSAAPHDLRSPWPPFLRWFATLALTLIALYLFAQL